MTFNGPSREVSVDLPDHVVYCVDCGNIFVYQAQRDCPTCTIAEHLGAAKND